MSIMPGAVWRPIVVPGGHVTRTLGRGVILHVAVSEATSLYGFFNNNANANSHFYVAKDGTCLTPDMRVLTSDLRWIPGGDVHVGDRLVGFDEGGAGISGGRRYHETIVEWVQRDEAEVYAVVLDDERVIYTTADHRWLAQTNESWAWRQTKDEARRTLVGARVPRLFDPWETREDYAAGWFAGILDGEGTLTARHRLGFSQRPTDVLDRALEYMKSEGLDFALRDVAGGRGDCQYIDVLGTLADRMRVLGSHRPTRLLQKVNVDTWGALRSSRTRYSTVLAVYPVGVREIVKMQTSTRTFIAEGFGMHNCEQYIDTAYVSWTSVDANKNTIGVETQGGVTNVETEPWTAAQVTSLAKICAWAHATEGTPLQQMTNSLSTTRGIGYHRLGINPWRLNGSEVWSSTTGKVCPGNAKIAQVPQIISLASTPPPAPTPPPSEGPLMALSDAQQTELYNTVRILGQQMGGPDWAAGNWGWPTLRYSSNGESLTVVDLLREIDRQLNSALDLAGRPGGSSDNEFGQILSLRAEVHALAAKLDAVAAKVGA